MSDVQSASPPSGAAWKSGIVIVAVILVGFTAYALKAILAPFLLAVFLLLMIDGVARALRDRIPGFPASLAMPAALILIVAFFLLTIWMVAANTTEFVGQAGRYGKRLDDLLVDFAARTGVKVPTTAGALLQRLDPGRFAGTAVRAVQDVASGAFVVLIYLGFLVASRSSFGRKGGKLFRSTRSKDEAERIFGRIREGVEGYVWLQTVAGLMIAVAAGALMLAVGLSHAVFWAFTIFVFSYVPVIGGAIGTILPPIFALVEFPTLVQPAVLFVGLQAIGFVVGSILQPRMQGSSLNVDPVVVFLSLAFWSALWGLTGAFLSTPLTVMVMAVLAQFSSTHWIAVLLSSNGDPYPETPDGRAPGRLVN